MESWAEHGHAADWARLGQAPLTAAPSLGHHCSSHCSKQTSSLDTVAARLQVCRNYNFGREGSSKGLYFDKFLAPTRLNDDAVPWTDSDLSYLQLPR